MQCDFNPIVVHPLRALASIPRIARGIDFRTTGWLFPPGGHWQGIQARYDHRLQKQIAFLSHDSETTAYIAVVAFPAGPHSTGEMCHIQELPSDGRQPPLRHAGGMQLIGDYLVVGVEDNQDKRRSQIQFWDVSNPLRPVLQKPLTVFRENAQAKKQTAGAVGIVKRRDDHLLVVANWDAADLDFYTSNGNPLGDDGCCFALHTTWSQREANTSGWVPDNGWGSYQALNLICDSDRRTYLFGFATSDDNVDHIDMFAVDLSQDPPNMLSKRAKHVMQFHGDVHFRYSGGLSISSSSQLACYATEGATGETTQVNVSP